MLKSIRKRTGGIVVKGLLFLLIASFAVWGIQDIFVPRLENTPVAEVGDVEVSQQEFEYRVQREINRLRTMFGNTFSIEQARSLGLVDAVLEDQVRNTLLRLGAEDLDVLISDELVRSQIRNDPNFRALGNNFDRFRFQQVLESNGLSEGQYIIELRQSLAARQFFQSLQAGGVAPKAMVDALYKHRQEMRSANVINVADSVIAKTSDPTDSQITKYYNDHNSDFMAPEYRGVTFIHLKASDLAAEMTISDEDVANSYDERADEFNSPETRTILQMILPDEAKADEAARLLSEGRDFAAVAKEIAGQSEDSLELGPLDKNSLLPELATPVFAAAKNAITEKVKSPLGWHLIKIKEIVAAGTKPIETVREDIRNQLALEKAVDGLFDLSNKLEDAIGGGATLNEAANTINLKSIRVEAIDRTGRDVSGTPVKDIPPGNTFLDTLFNLDEGLESPVMDAGNDDFFIVRVDSITPSAVKSINMVRSDVINSWKREQLAEKAEVAVKKIVERLNSGETLDRISKELNLTPKVIKGTTREGSSGADISQTMITNLFSLQPGHATMARTTEGFEIAVLDKVIPANPLSDSKGVKEASANLDNDLRNDINDQLALSLRNKFGVTYNRNVISQLFGMSESTH